jgi:hypothetical protein
MRTRPSPAKSFRAKGEGTHHILVLVFIVRLLCLVFPTTSLTADGDLVVRYQQKSSELERGDLSWDFEINPGESSQSVLYWSSMAALPKKRGFSNRAPDHITDELVSVLGKGAAFEFKELFPLVFAGLKLKNATSGGNEMLRLRCHEKLQYLVRRGLVLKTGKVYKGLKNLDQASSVNRIAKINAVIAARVAAGN